MTDSISVPSELWRDIRDFILPRVSPCKECVRGNPNACWNADCGAFKYRNLARRIGAVQNGNAPAKPRYVLVEDEILSALALYDRPVPPSRIVLETTHSKANKHSAVKRLIRMGQIVETFAPNGSRMISLPRKERKNR